MLLLHGGQCRCNPFRFFVFVSAIALFVSLVINIFVVAVFAEVIKDFYRQRDSNIQGYSSSLTL